LLSSVTIIRPFAGVSAHSAASMATAFDESEAPGATPAKPPVVIASCHGL
jgi:hypothetical protein